MLGLLTAVWFSLAQMSVVAAAEVNLTNVNVVKAENNFLITATLKDAFTDEIMQSVNSGLPTNFEFKLKLVKQRKSWFDKVIHKEQFTHTVTYDNLKKEYSVIVNRGMNREVLLCDDEAKMKQMMCKVNKLVTIKKSLIQKSNEFKVFLKANLKSYKLPTPFDYLLFFIAFDIDTEWISSSPEEIPYGEIN